MEAARCAAPHRTRTRHTTPFQPDMIGPVEILQDARHYLELAAVFCAALSGGLAAVRKSYDVFSVLLLAWVTGLGGGIIRDVLIGATPPVGITSWDLVLTSLLGGLVIQFFHPRLERMRRGITVLDAGALAMFVVVGVDKGLDHGVGPLAAVFVGLITGIGGGLVRDLLVGEPPIVLRERELYAIPATFGAVVTVVLAEQGVLGYATGGAVVVGIFVVRLVSLRMRWRAPGPWQGFGRRRLGT
ncbi:membrane protein [Flavimobilis marinus]|uniref:Uncharacterized membrane protein YeiH n=1 Tax=Flavimobilis marinus TaxID=285351 RepID=A0A1I2FQ91_9MICO|nr:membrane protein [Flavimobilis marinus]SFF06968.1 Uncharacterized membrane protein YeiH [Flavimobilis marinus]